MARPERKTVDYFPHYISDGKKMFYIEQKYGNDGYATWFKILEALASTDDHFLNLSNEMDLLFLSAKCRVQKEVLIYILDDLCILKEIDHFLWLNRIVYSHKFIESIQDAYSRRSNKCMNYDSFCIRFEGLCTTITRQNYEKQYNNPQSKVKYSKEEESKPNKSKVILQKFIEKHNLDESLISEYVALRKTKKANVSETVLNSIEEESLKANISVEVALKTIITQGWQGFKAEWYQNLHRNSLSQVNQQPTQEPTRFDKFNNKLNELLGEDYFNQQNQINE